ncbi:MAG: citrate/2-methylcitrate synthase [Candidatus Eisenbacteria bacterium]|nr:citrate synthase/methylcitrate synthase [Candidatus Eisenbacteria bacterium]
MTSTHDLQELVRAAKEKALQETSDEPEPQRTGAHEWPIDAKIGKGLEGAPACDTEVGYVNGAKGWLVYRGINIFDLAEYSTYEETAFLLLYGHLPTKVELDGFVAKIRAAAPMAPEAKKILEIVPTAKAHPMSTLRTCASVEGNLDPRADDTSVEYEQQIAIRMIAQLATITGAIARIRKGKEPLPPDPTLSHAGNLLWMMTGQKPDPVIERTMDISLILHADHGMNASTFATMVVNSSLSDMYGSVVAGIASLKGPLHGGANERVLYDLEEIGTPENVEPWFRKAMESKRRVMGFGHRVYKAYDPRARIFGPIARLLADRNPEVKRLYQVAEKLDSLLCGQLGEKKIFPNVDFYSGLIYRAMEIETAMFTPIFAVSRVAGWTARSLEYLQDNRIFRPRAVYVGPISSPYIPMAQR